MLWNCNNLCVRIGPQTGNSSRAGKMSDLFIPAYHCILQPLTQCLTHASYSGEVFRMNECCIKNHMTKGLVLED